MRRLVLFAVISGALFGVSSGAASAAPQAETAAGTSILCLNGKGTKYVRKSAPPRCAHFGPGGSFGGGVFLEQLQWQGFGAATATATGIECGFHLPCSNVPVTVTAFRLRKACGRRVYTRLSASSNFGTTTVKMTRCPGPAS